MGQVGFDPNSFLLQLSAGIASFKVAELLCEPYLLPDLPSLTLLGLSPSGFALPNCFSVYSLNTKGKNPCRRFRASPAAHTRVPCSSEPVMTSGAQFPTGAVDPVTRASQESGRGKMLLDGVGSPCQAARSLALRLSRPDCWGSPGNDSRHFPHASGECQATRVSVRALFFPEYACWGKGRAGRLSGWG